MVEEHSLGLLPLLKQDLIVLESGSRQPPKTSLSRSTPPSEDLRVCSHDDDPLAGSLEASEVGAFEERGAAVDGATLKASAAMFQGAADCEDTCHHGGSEAMIPSVCIGAESCAESHEKGASLFTERVYSSGASILLERQANYACQFCPYMTKWKASMIHHRRMHKRILPHKCDICGRGYLRQSTLRYHMRTHTDEHPYQCSLCPSTFSCRKSLTEHKSTHTDERPYLCNVCDRAFKTLNALTSHRRTHTVPDKLRHHMREAKPQQTPKTSRSSHFLSSGSVYVYSKLERQNAPPISETTPGKNNIEELPQKEQVYVPFADAAHEGTVTSSVNGAALTTALTSFGEFKVVGAEGSGQTYVLDTGFVPLHATTVSTAGADLTTTLSDYTEYNVASTMGEAHSYVLVADSVRKGAVTDIGTDAQSTGRNVVGNTGTEQANILVSDALPQNTSAGLAASTVSITPSALLLKRNTGSAIGEEQAYVFLDEPTPWSASSTGVEPAEGCLTIAKSSVKATSVGSVASSTANDDDDNELNATEVEKALAAVIKCASEPSRTASVTGDKSSRAAEARQGNSAYYVTVSSLGPMNIAEEHSYSSRQGIFAVKQPEYACPLCPFKTRHRSAFRPHQLLHTGGKPHQCEVCGQTFRLSYTLRQHMRTHTGERPYRCEVCDRRFSVNNCLRVHMRAHTGERPYQCKFCDKAFVALHGLKNHLSSHSTEKPFHCDSCAKSFPYAAALKYHKARHCHHRSTGVGTSACHGSEMCPDAISIVQQDHDDGSQG